MVRSNVTMFCDFETFSAAPIKNGVFNYAQHPSTKVICLAYSFDQKEINLWTPDKPFPVEILKHINNGGAIRSFNVTFEYAIFKYVLGIDIPINSLRCTMTDALALSLPTSLENAAIALELEDQKDKRGKLLIQRLSKPKKATKAKPYTRVTPDIEPEMFQEFYEYCKQDVKTEIAIFNAMPRHIKEQELELFQLTLKINERGLPVDRDLVDAVLKAKDEYEIKLNKEIEIITDGRLISTNSRPQSMKWLAENGLVLEKYDKKHISDALEINQKPVDVHRFLEIRSELSRTPIKKFNFLQTAICGDSTIKNNLVFHKATTGRFAGSGFQIQNLPRDSSDNPQELIDEFLSGDCVNDVYTKAIKLVRPAIAAPRGMKLLVSDFASIENRVLAWCARDTQTLIDFENNVDQYKTAAAGIYKVDYNDVTKEQRQLGKIAVLSCGYGGGAVTFQTICRDSWGVTLGAEESKDIVDGYRKQYSKIVSYWYRLYDTAMTAVLRNIVTEYKGIKFRVMNDFLYMRLPNGRLISYYKPKIENVVTPWGQKKLSITHMGSNTYSRKWERLNITHGRLTENVVQAVARDFLTEAMLRVENAGYDIIACVHDEIISLVDKDFGSLEHFNELMEIKPTWALDCPIKAEGYSCERYRK